MSKASLASSASSSEVQSEFYSAPLLAESLSDPMFTSPSAVPTSSVSPIRDCVSSGQQPKIPDPQIVDIPINSQIEEILSEIEAPTFTEPGQVPIVNPEQSTDIESFDTRQHDNDFSTIILPSVDRRLDAAAIGNVSPTVTESGQDPVNSVEQSTDLESCDTRHHGDLSVAALPSHDERMTIAEVESVPSATTNTHAMVTRIGK
ncbi:hypothetical protein V6N13_111063 [Hibiscus sabdariffa]